MRANFILFPTRTRGFVINFTCLSWIANSLSLAPPDLWNISERTMTSKPPAQAVFETAARRGVDLGSLGLTPPTLNVLASWNPCVRAPLKLNGETYDSEAEQQQAIAKLLSDFVKEIASAEDEDSWKLVLEAGDNLLVKIFLNILDVSSPVEGGELIDHDPTPEEVASGRGAAVVRSGTSRIASSVVQALCICAMLCWDSAAPVLLRYVPRAAASAPSTASSAAGAAAAAAAGTPAAQQHRFLLRHSAACASEYAMTAWRALRASSAASSADSTAGSVKRPVGVGEFIAAAEKAGPVPQLLVEALVYDCLSLASLRDAASRRPSSSNAGGSGGSAAAAAATEDQEEDAEEKNPDEDDEEAEEEDFDPESLPDFEWAEQGLKVRLRLLVMVLSRAGSLAEDLRPAMSDARHDALALAALRLLALVSATFATTDASDASAAAQPDSAFSLVASATAMIDYIAPHRSALVTSSSLLLIHGEAAIPDLALALLSRQKQQQQQAGGAAAAPAPGAAARILRRGSLSPTAASGKGYDAAPFSEWIVSTINSPELRAGAEPGGTRAVHAAIAIAEHVFASLPAISAEQLSGASPATSTPSAAAAAAGSRSASSGSGSGGSGVGRPMLLLLYESDAKVLLRVLTRCISDTRDGAADPFIVEEVITLGAMLSRWSVLYRSAPDTAAAVAAGKTLETAATLRLPAKWAQDALEALIVAAEVTARPVKPISSDVHYPCESSRKSANAAHKDMWGPGSAIVADVLAHFKAVMPYAIV